MDSMDDAQKKPTIRDVARLAGVSYGTVSRYLNGNTHVSQEQPNASQQPSPNHSTRRTTPHAHSRNAAHSPSR